MDIRQIPLDKLKDVVASSISWSEAIRKIGKTPRGACFQCFQSKIRKLGLDTSHFLGYAAHAGPRSTGKAKKKHWSQILIERKTLDRESCGKFRRAYTEYCKEKMIYICCVECGNKGLWRKKKLRLQINHKDERRWNNIPSNLEWVCPNCHDIKTSY